MRLLDIINSINTSYTQKNFKLKRKRLDSSHTSIDNSLCTSLKLSLLNKTKRNKSLSRSVRSAAQIPSVHSTLEKGVGGEIIEGRERPKSALHTFSIQPGALERFVGVIRRHKNWVVGSKFSDLRIVLS